MKTTYMVETSNQYLLGYFTSLSAAKEYGINVNKAINDQIMITKLVGPSFGEGYHFYKIYLNNNKWQLKQK